MPAIRGIYYNHPTTGEAGLWVLLMHGQVRGRTDAELQAYVDNATGTDAEKILQFEQQATDYLQAGMEQTWPKAQFMQGWSQAEQNAWIASPPEFYRLEGNQVVAKLSVVTVDIIELSPLRYQITVSNGASGSETKYG